MNQAGGKGREGVGAGGGFGEAGNKRASHFSCVCVGHPGECCGLSSSLLCSKTSPLLEAGRLGALQRQAQRAGGAAPVPAGISRPGWGAFLLEPIGPSWLPARPKGAGIHPLPAHFQRYGRNRSSVWSQLCLGSHPSLELTGCVGGRAACLPQPQSLRVENGGNDA